MDILDMLEAVGVVEPPSREVLARTAEKIEAAVELELRVRDVKRSTHKWNGRQKRFRALLAAAALLVAAGLAAGLVPFDADSPTAAAVVLRHLAEVAANQDPIAPPGPGQYLFVDSESDSLTSVSGQGGYDYLQTDHREIWISSDGSGRLIDSFGTPIFLTAGDRAAWKLAGSPPISSLSSDTAFGTGGLSYGPADISQLPTNPQELFQEIATREIENGPPGAGEDFIQIGDLLRETDASPALRSALFDVASNLPGVELLGQTTDQYGRRGVGFAEIQAGVRYELIFGIGTSKLLGEKQTIADTSSGYAAPVGTVIGWSIYVDSGIVNSLPPTTPQTKSGPSSPRPLANGQLPFPGIGVLKHR